MLRRHRLLIFGFLLIGTGIGSYFFDPQKDYGTDATYELSRFQDDHWQKTVVTGSQLNQQAKDAKGMNAVMAVGIVAFGVSLLGFEWWRTRR